MTNLAYAYLHGDNTNPKRGLAMVDQGLRYLPNKPKNENYRTHFYDTRGKALIQLDRMPEAIEAFKKALRVRPDNEKILASLIECCKAAEIDSADYEKHLQEIQEGDAKEK